MHASCTLRMHCTHAACTLHVHCMHNCMCMRSACAHYTHAAATFAAAEQALGGDDRKMADLCMTMGCYSAVSQLLNMFEVALPPGETLPFPEVA